MAGSDIRDALARGDAAHIRQLLAGPRCAAKLKALGEELDDTDPAQLATLLELAPAVLDQPMLPDVLFLALVKAALAEGSSATQAPQAMPYGAVARPAEKVLAQIEPRVRASASLGNRIALLAFNLSQSDQFEASIALYERIIAVPGLERTAYNNALWAVMADNNKLPVQPERHSRFLAACVPHGPENPSIFYNAACVWYELDELDRVLEHLQLAVDHGYPRPEQMQNEPLFAPISTDPRFVAIFAREKTAKKTPRNR